MELSHRSGGDHLGELRVEFSRSAAVVRSSLRERGLVPTLRTAAHFASARAGRRRAVAQRAGRTFAVQGNRLPYELGRHNSAWLNERTVEVPVARRALEGIDPVGVLEVGNVLGHYGYRGHTVLDKYERLRGVVNEDARSFSPGRTFDAVVAVSTLEHIGFDEPERDPDGPVRALEHLRGLLASDGFLLVTVPLGYNSDLDAAVRAGTFDGRRTFGLRRLTDDNTWAEAPVEELVGLRYGDPWPNAGAVVVVVDGPGAGRVPL